MIGRTSIEGVPVLTLSSQESGLEAALAPGAGMVTCSLRHRGEELLGQRGGLAAYVREGGTMGIPLLHPWANRLAASAFEVAGAPIRLDLGSPRVGRDASGLPIHGLLAGMPGWEVLRHERHATGGVLSARFDFAAQRELIEMFPIPHEVGIEADLDGGELRIATTLRAHNNPVPVSFGFHPYFRLPGLPREDWEVYLPVREHLGVDRLGLPSGRRSPAGIRPGRLGTRTFDDAFLAPADSEPLVLAGGGRRIEVRFGAAYRFAQIYAPAADDVVAIEPMTAPTNALVSGEGLHVLGPGEDVTASFSIAVN